jgi:hypothetical protein
MAGSLGARKDQATRGEKKKKTVAQAELKKSSDTGSWGAVQSVTTFVSKLPSRVSQLRGALPCRHHLCVTTFDPPSTPLDRFLDPFHTQVEDRPFNRSASDARCSSHSSRGYFVSRITVRVRLTELCAFLVASVAVAITV